MLSRLCKPIAVFVLLSVLLHGFFWEGLSFFPRQTAAPRSVPLEIEIVEQDSLKRPDQVDARKQIVEQREQINDEIDEKAKYLSQFNQKVVKETRAEKSGDFSNQVKPGAQLAGADKPTPKREDKPREKGELPSLDSLRPKFSPTPQGQESAVSDPGRQSQTDDYLKEPEKGIQTLLSTREFVYYSYYSRIKEKLKQHWEPNIRERVRMIYKTGRTVASAKDIVTGLVVTLDAQGSLVGIEVVTESGNQTLDDAAVDAFKKSAPFPNPPRGIVESDGRIRIRWDFILEASFAPLDTKSNYAERDP